MYYCFNWIVVFFFQIWSQAYIDGHGSSSELTCYSRAFSPVLHPVHHRATSDGPRIRLSGVRSIRVGCGVGWRQVGDDRWSLQLLPVADRLHHSILVVTGTSKLEGFAASFIHSRMCTSCSMVRLNLLLN